MALTAEQTTAQNFKDFYDRISPLLDTKKYYVDRSGAELGYAYASLDSNWTTSEANVPMIKRSGSIVQPSTGLFTIPDGLTVEITYCHSASGPSGDFVMGFYNNTDSEWITNKDNAEGLKEFCPFHVTSSNTSYCMGDSYTIQWTNNKGHDVDVSLRVRSNSVTGSLREDYSSLSIKEIGRVVDPVKYVSNNSDLQETPVGNIISYMGNTVPKHYLACDGTQYAIGSYPELEAFIIEEFGTVNYFGGNGTTDWAVPDLRGEFLRGTGTNSHTNNFLNKLEGSGASVGEHQDATVMAEDDSSWVAMTQGVIENNPTFDAKNGGQSRRCTDTGALTDAAGWYITSRPTNTSVKYCIKYESTFHAFFSNATYKVSVKASVASYSGSAIDITFDNTDIVGDASMVSGNSFITPLDGMYSIGMNWSNAGVWDQNYMVNVNGTDVYHVVGIGITDVLYLQKGDVVKIKTSKTSAQSGRANFALLTSNYNPTIVSGDNFYSENEQVVGYWTDGKPIYKKTFKATLTSTGLTVVGTIQNHDVIVSMEGYTEYKTNGYVPLTYAYAADDMQTMFVNNDGSIKAGGKYTGPTSVTVKYTKTTDTASSLQVENSLLLNRPDLWEVGTEYHFGGGLYGYRKTGTISSLRGARTYTEICSNGATAIVSYGGQWGVANSTDDYWQIGNYDNFTNPSSSGLRLRRSTGQIGLFTCTSDDRTDGPYDVWVTYKK